MPTVSAPICPVSEEIPALLTILAYLPTAICARILCAKIVPTTLLLSAVLTAVLQGQLETKVINASVAKASAVVVFLAEPISPSDVRPSVSPDALPARETEA